MNESHSSVCQTQGDNIQGRIQDLKLGGAYLKKNHAERREARKFLGYFVWKIRILGKKIIFFPILGGRAPGAPPPLNPPLILVFTVSLLSMQH